MDTRIQVHCYSTHLYIYIYILRLLLKLDDIGCGVALLSNVPVFFFLNLHLISVMDVKWNKCNGNWLLSCSRDQLIKLYDIRTMQEMATFKGHGKEVIRVVSDV